MASATAVHLKELLSQLQSAFETLEAEKKALQLDNQRLQHLFWQKPGKRTSERKRTTQHGSTAAEGRGSNAAALRDSGHAAPSPGRGVGERRGRAGEPGGAAGGQAGAEEDGEVILFDELDDPSVMLHTMSDTSTRPNVRSWHTGKVQPKKVAEEEMSAGRDDSDSDIQKGQRRQKEEVDVEVLQGELLDDGTSDTETETSTSTADAEEGNPSRWVVCDVDKASTASQSMDLRPSIRVEPAHPGTLPTSEEGGLAFTARASAGSRVSRVKKSMLSGLWRSTQYGSRGSSESLSSCMDHIGARGAVSGDFGTWKDNVEGARSTWQVVDAATSDSCGSVADPTLILPSARWRVAWSFFVLMWLLYELWAVPLQTIFLSEPSELNPFVLLGSVSDGIFILDFCVCCCQAMFQKPLAALDPAVSNFFRQWFPLDLFGSFPGHIVAWIVLSVEGKDGNSIHTDKHFWSALLYLRFLRLPRLFGVWTKKRWNSPFVAPYSRQHLIDGAIIAFMWIHLNACVWAWLMKWHDRHETDDHEFEDAWTQQLHLSNAFDEYIASLWWACSALFAGSPDQYHLSTSGRALEILAAIQRILAASILLRWLLLRVLVVDQELLSDQRVEIEVSRLLGSHNIKGHVHHEVIWHVRHFLRARTRESRLGRLMQQEIPKETLERFCSVAWARHLLSLNLFVRISQWHGKFIEAMAVRVREHICPEGVILCRRGELATGAYCIVSGMVGMQVKVATYLPFTPGMWIGEKALVIGTRKRSTTCRALQSSTLMFVGSEAFREVLVDAGLYESFEQLCADEVWRGLCGRCGSLGDHFTRNCPFDVGLGMRGRHKGTGGGTAKGMMKKVLTNASTVSVASSEPERSGGAVGAMGPMQGALLAYLRDVGLQRLEPELTTLGIHSFDALLQMDMGDFKVHLAYAGEPLQPHEEELLTREAIDSHREKVKAFTKKMLATTANDQHLIFLSHAKAEAGVDCVLLRTELEGVLAQSPPKTATRLARPIFLDIEDLANVMELRTHVSKSFNFFLVLTPSVLTRAWCLVEIASAVEFGVHIILVELMKRGTNFTMPDEEYYRKLREGEILDEAGMHTLRTCGIELEQVEKSVREAFTQIALPYSPQRSQAIRKQELAALIERCQTG